MKVWIAAGRTLSGLPDDRTLSALSGTNEPVTSATSSANPNISGLCVLRPVNGLATLAMMRHVRHTENVRSILQIALAVALRATNLPVAVAQSALIAVLILASTATTVALDLT